MPALPAAHDGHGKRRLIIGRPATPPAPAAAPAIVAAPAVPVAVAAPPAAAPEPAAAPPPARGVREVLAEADKLLAQGEVGEACTRGEEANRLAPKSPAVHKFLGKCYRRA